MRALVATGEPGRLDIADLPAPEPAQDEVVVEVRAISVNRGELHRLDTASAGWRPGWDFAGVLRSAPAQDIGIQPGARVFGMMPGAAWAEQIAVPLDHIAELPQGLTWAQGASLGVAGVTAMRILRLHPPGLPEASVLVTGAAGGVGRLAVQLARQGGAHVTAIVGSPDRAAGLEALGATEVHVGSQPAGQAFDLALESVGGDSLARALEAVKPGGSVVTFGNSSRQATSFLVNDFYRSEGTLRGFFLWRDVRRDPPARDLADLAQMVLSGALTVDIDEATDWTAIHRVLAQLRDRQVAGKAVLTIGPL